jgi:hypothetical protein
LIELSESTADYLGSVQDYLLQNGTTDSDKYFLYKRNAAHRDILSFLEGTEDE